MCHTNGVAPRTRDGVGVAHGPRLPLRRHPASGKARITAVGRRVRRCTRDGARPRRRATGRGRAALVGRLTRRTRAGRVRRACAGTHAMVARGCGAADENSVEFSARSLPAASWTDSTSRTRLGLLQSTRERGHCASKSCQPRVGLPLVNSVLNPASHAATSAAWPSGLSPR